MVVLESRIQSSSCNNFFFLKNIFHSTKRTIFCELRWLYFIYVTYFYFFHWEWYRNILLCQGRYELHIYSIIPWILYANENPLSERFRSEIFAAFWNWDWHRFHWTSFILNGRVREFRFSRRQFTACYLCGDMLANSLDKLSSFNLFQLHLPTHKLLKLYLRRIKRASFKWE